MTAPATTTRVLIAIESRLYLDTLKAALESEPDLEVVAEAADAESAIDEAQRASVGIVLMSSGLPGFADGRAGCLLRDRHPACRIIVLADNRDQRLLAEGLGCGASGYLTKDASMAELVEAIRGVARGEVLIPPAMLGPLLSDLMERRKGHDDALVRLSRLSPRERQVLALVARGRKTSDIASDLVISPETARTHVQNTLAKLGVHSRLEAASFVIEHGLVSHLEATAA